VKRSFVVVGAAVGATLAADGAANPPPPKVLPDPPISAPAKDEMPTVVRKHEGICYAFYPAGGTLPIKCPKELIVEPIGEAILKNPSGRCQYIPFQSGGPGRAGFLDKCPELFAQVGKANVIPDEAKKLLQELAASRESHDDTQWVDPPQPARLDTTAPQQVGCTGCATTRASPTGAFAAVFALAAVVQLARRHFLPPSRAAAARRRALRPRRAKSTFPRHGESDGDL
jgi:uncharacterized protein (TIGR03382 family)